MKNNMYKKSLILMFISFGLITCLQAQDADTAAIAVKTAGVSDKINPEQFDAKRMANAILDQINAYRVKNDQDSLRRHEILDQSAQDQATFMEFIKNTPLEQPTGKKADTGKRLEFYGGSKMAEELVLSFPISKGRETYGYAEAARGIVDKWVKGKKTVLVVKNGTYVYAGVGIAMDVPNKKVYVSVVFGSFKSFNLGKTKGKELNMPFTKKKFRLKSADEKECKGCEKFGDMDKLQEGLSVKDGYIFFKYPNAKALQKLMKGKKDGLAVDIIQKDQYPCGKNYNIYDNNLLNKGVMLKRMWAPKLFKKNMVEDPKSRALEVVLGKMPAKITGEYELNLLVIQNKRICKVLTRKYMEDGGSKSKTPMEVLPDTANTDGKRFSPSSESTTLSFVIPFEKSKFNYAAADIKPFIKSLNEPDFLIDEINISAYSSIEGDSAKNAELQSKRAESIVKALASMQKDKTVKKVTTADSWAQFRDSVAKTEFANLGKMSRAEAIQEMVSKKLFDRLENILAKGRYAEINMVITYDNTGKKEQAYSTKMLEKSIRKKEVAKALRIQNYIIGKILKGDYTLNALNDVEIPMDSVFASLAMNKLWLQIHSSGDSLRMDQYNKIKDLRKLAPRNNYVAFNSIFGYIKLAQISKETSIDSMQAQLQNLYYAKFDKDMVDALNLEYQFKVIDYADSLNKPSGQALVQKSIQRIKSVYKIDESSTWQNALKFAYIFIKNNDYNYALKVLEPFAKLKDANEDVVFTYVVLCSHYDDKITSVRFANALKRAKNFNPQRYCKLFGDPAMSFQVFDNPFVKEEYCKTCAK